MRHPSLHDNRGATALEFSLILPVLVMMIFGIVEFGGAFYKQQIVTASARAGARYGVLANDPRASATQIASRSIEYLADSGLDPMKAVVSVSGAGGESGEELSVEVSYPAKLPVVSSLGNAGNTGNVVLVGTIVAQFE